MANINFKRWISYKNSNRISFFLKLKLTSLKILETVDILCEFFEVSFHLILYVREVYPNG